MAFSLTKTLPRLWSLEEGLAMVVTDLHGDWDAYRRYRDRFVDLQGQGRADCLIFTGDLIHHENPDEPDQSLEIVLDVLDLQAAYGEAIIYLCGNHEMPHIYSISLARGDRIYTPDFELALNHRRCRTEVISLFDSLPFYVRTQAGVSLAHAGAPAAVAAPGKAAQLFAWNHQQLLRQTDELLAAEDIASLREGYAKLNHIPYDILAQYFLDVSGPQDPRYNDLLRGFIASNLPPFKELLWPALFTRCEQSYGAVDYAIFLDALLKELSADFFPQQFLVAGHMAIRGGYQIIIERHVRLASARHATPREAGHYLLFDTTQSIQNIQELLPGLGSIYQ